MKRVPLLTVLAASIAGPMSCASAQDADTATPGRGTPLALPLEHEAGLGGLPLVRPLRLASGTKIE